MSDINSLSTFERWDGEIPGSHQFSTLENFTYDPDDRGHSLFQRAAEKLVKQWQGDQFVGLSIHGEPGTGKSHAAIALARALHEEGADIFYRFVPDLGSHSQGVSDWSAPRILEPVYAYGNKQVTKTTSISEADGVDIRTTETQLEGDTRLVKRDANSVFPNFYDRGLSRNPKTVLILDDYKPLWRPHTRAAIEAASNFGGAVIMTSNFGNVFGLADPGGSDVTRVDSSYGEPDAIKQAKNDALNLEIEKVRNAFMSRLVGGFLEIKFSGIDQRKQDSFWTDMIDPSDFAS